jgi:hypothetical protein
MCMTKPPQLKAIDPSVKIYYVFKLSNILYAVYDIQMIMPIQYGSLQIVESTVKSIKAHVKGSYVFYMDNDTTAGFKKSDVKTRTHNP